MDERPEKKNSTVGQAYKTGKAVEQIFEAWLPLDWLLRVEDPDFHSDYTVEIVENGELTARQFRAQVKGRTAKLKDGKIKESLETKHLRYYLINPQPVFIFRIDPQTKTGNWLFIQRYLKERKLADKLDKQDNLTIEFDQTQSGRAGRMASSPWNCSGLCCLTSQPPPKGSRLGQEALLKLTQQLDRFNVNAQLVEQTVEILLRSSAGMEMLA